MRQPVEIPSYVLMVVLSPGSTWAVGLTKKKGPEKLLNKLCFPGGHIEAGETPEQAGSREMQEETGLLIPESGWTRIRHEKSAERELVCLAATSAEVLTARQMTLEPVWHLAVPRHLDYAAASPDSYAPNFLSDLQAAIACEARQALSPA